MNRSRHAPSRHGRGSSHHGHHEGDPPNRAALLCGSRLVNSIWQHTSVNFGLSQEVFSQTLPPIPLYNSPAHHDRFVKSSSYFSSIFLTIALKSGEFTGSPRTLNIHFLEMLKMFRPNRSVSDGSRHDRHAEQRHRSAFRKGCPAACSHSSLQQRTGLCELKIT